MSNIFFIVTVIKTIRNSTNQIDFNSMDQTNWNSLTSLTPTTVRRLLSIYTHSIYLEITHLALDQFIYVDKIILLNESLTHAQILFVEMTVNSIDEMSSLDDEKRENMKP